MIHYIGSACKKKDSVPKEEIKFYPERVYQLWHEGLAGTREVEIVENAGGVLKVRSIGSIAGGMNLHLNYYGKAWFFRYV